MASEIKDSEEKPINGGHPDDFQVSGPRNLSKPTWRDIINSSWRDEKYKRTVMACFIQAVYLVELDRQEKREGEAALAPKWWEPFKYKMAEVLVDKRDGSVFGAIFEWDRSAALSDLLLIRPRKAPRAVVALRGTLLRGPTMRRDIEDDLRILTTENLRGSCRFKITLEVVRNAVARHGSANVYMTGHSLGAGLVLQVGKALAEEEIYVEAHLFNPPSVSLAMGLRSIGEKMELLWKGAVDMARAILPKKKSEGFDEKDDDSSSSVVCEELRKWVPHLYVNDSDYICCYYNDESNKENSGKLVEGREEVKSVVAKLYVMSKGPRKFLEAHGLQQWWSVESELQMGLNSSRLIQRQLSSLGVSPQLKESRR
ncbi:hypothetical protein SUGI_0062400 [Cryptomeria japonica]|uniref:GDSL esterase/lipase At4g10955 n=1 Tax=Cryptomeria japonica TaxID=3369 RepID=UPI002408D5C4|nr:GDSL esterase/lipase At4g10955 [Cryptomeria japonica]GLJ07232.1 hypothetical protein SUGI_0062400 [Cryptomeria japonica]